MALFNIDNLSFTYPQAAKPALNQVSLTIEQGSCVLLAGHNASGKTTLLRHLKPELTPLGRREGSVNFKGAPLGELSDYEQASQIGYVGQTPDNMLVCDTVAAELAFGLENLGVDRQTMRVRVAEVAMLLGLEDVFEQPLNELSGGQKQLVCLGSALALKPTVLVLDEPTAQLSPRAAEQFVSVLAKLNRIHGITLVVAEQNIEQMFDSATHIVVLDEGSIVAQGTSDDVAQQPCLRELIMLPSLEFYAIVGSTTPSTPAYGSLPHDSLPLDMSSIDTSHDALTSDVEQDCHKQTRATQQSPMVELGDVWFQYEKDKPFVLRNLNASFSSAQVHGILGSNGSGKSTLLQVICGLRTPQRGWVKCDGVKQKSQGRAFPQAIMLPQRIADVFVGTTVAGELEEMQAEPHVVEETVVSLGLAEFLDAQVFDLSVGQQQRVALAKALLMRPNILVLDEPTKALDAPSKHLLGNLFHQFTQGGTTIIMATHDVAFCQAYADTLSLLFNGEILVQSDTSDFLQASSYATPSYLRRRFEL